MSNTAKTVSEKTPAKAWLILAVTYFLSFMAPMCQFKVPPLASWIIPTYGLDGVTFGYLMSALSIIGVILAFPAAFIVRRLGLKNVVILSGVCFVAGAAMSAANTSLAVLYISRLIEGIGIGLVGVAAPTCVSIWFPEKTRGFALGIWATWMPVGTILMFNIAPTMATLWGFRSVFWMVAALSLVALILFALVFKLPEGETGTSDVQGTLKENISLIKNKEMWLLGVVFFAMNFIIIGVTNSFYNTFLVTVRGLDDVTAGSLTSLINVLGIVAIVSMGFVYAYLRDDQKRYSIMLGFALTIVAACIGFSDGTGSDASTWFYIISMALVSGLIAGTVRPFTPVIMGGGAMGATMGMSILAFCQNLGAACGSPIFGWAYESLGWAHASYAILVPLAVIGLICAFFVVPKSYKKAKAEKKPETLA